MPFSLVDDFLAFPPLAAAFHVAARSRFGHPCFPFWALAGTRCTMWLHSCKGQLDDDGPERNVRADHAFRPCLAWLQHPATSAVEIKPGCVAIKRDSTWNQRDMHRRRNRIRGTQPTLIAFFSRTHPRLRAFSLLTEGTALSAAGRDGLCWPAPSMCQHRGMDYSLLPPPCPQRLSSGCVCGQAKQCGTSNSPTFPDAAIP
jgi:hypothetical protein